jgi:dihydrofolate synthase/folylpolyglutamate synthase
MPDIGEKLSRLFARSAAGIKFDLRVTECLLEGLGHPERELPFVHVAGTNGKGSVCAMLDAIYRAAGRRTGLYTSPHLVRFNERIQVSGVPIADDELAALFDLVEPLDQRASAQTGRRATFFELTTAMAFEYFRRRRVELVVLETGMGGRLDATNVVDPLVSVITRIGLEHCQYLGDTIEKIAGEKAGIIKRGRPVVCAAGDPAADRVVQRVAAERNAPFIRAADAVKVQRLRQDVRGQRIKISTECGDYPPCRLPLLGRWQIENVAAAVAALEALGQRPEWAVDPEVVKSGLETVHWPARCQVMRADPLCVLDVAHNPCGARALAQALQELRKRCPWGLVFSLLADKDAQGFAQAFRGLVKRAWVVPLHASRAAPPETLAKAAQAMGWPTKIASLPAACADALAWARESSGAVCIAGSLYLAGELLEGIQQGAVCLKGEDPL